MFAFRGLISSLSASINVFSISESASFHTASVFYAARKGTRARKEAKKTRVEIKKVAWTPDSKKKKDIHVSRKVDESNLEYPEDDVFMQKDYKLRIFQFQEALAGIRETHHPTMYNLPNAFVGATVEISTTTHQKKVKYIDPWTHIVEVENTFDHGEDRSIIAFCKEHEIAAQLQDMGVALVGDVSTIKGIERGLVTLPTFEYVICNPKILADLMHIRGLLKKKIPALKNNTLGVDLVGITKRLQSGIKYSMKKDTKDQDFGYADFIIGRLNMSTEQLENNLKRVLQDINSMKPNSKPHDEDFITRILLWSDPSPEKMKLDMDNLIEKPKAKVVDDESDGEEEEQVAAKAEGA
uniref:39S ribosomal protein L1, mitochondrial n=1 Tax=Cacopsylla melanoneura TaxID=428564 RepID=A0A8D9BKY7_9HEMI